jgi:hypothetical protein
MKTVKLYDIAHARSGDKGPNSNTGVIFYKKSDYEFVKSQLTTEKIKAHFGGIVRGEIIKYELPNLNALNFILKDSLGGGGSESLINDAQGKTHGQMMLMMDVEIEE